MNSSLPTDLLDLCSFSDQMPKFFRSFDEVDQLVSASKLL
jgi:hypothetical protein